MTALPVRSESAERLAGEITGCRVCATHPIGKPLPHAPRPVARLSGAAPILICGQAPGRRVHESGLPFDDASGDRLRDWLGLDRALFYDPALVAFLPMGFCFPGNDAKGGDLPPRPECRALWHARAMAAMPQIKLLVLVGAYAQDWHLTRLGQRRLLAGTLSETVAGWKAFATLRRPLVFALPHPSWRNTGWLKKNPWFDRDVLPNLRAQVQETREAVKRR